MSFFHLRTRPARYGVAILLVLIDVAVRWSLVSVMGDKGAALFLVPAILLAAMMGGLGPGLLATLLGAALVDWLMLPPAYSLKVSDPADWIRLGVLAGVGVAVSWLGEYGRRVQQALATQKEALEASEERLRLAADAGRVGIFEWDVASKHSVWTARMEAIHGMEPGTYRGEYEQWLACVHPEDRARAERTVWDALESGAHEAEWRVVWPDGSVHWVESRGWLSRDPAGEPVRVMGVNIDITVRKQAEETLLATEASFRALVEHAPDAVLIADREGIYRGVNSNVIRLLGYTPEEFIGKRVRDLIRPEELPRLESVKVGPKAVEPHLAVWDMRHKDGHYVPVELSSRLLPDNRWVVFARDVSERKAAEEATRSAIESAEAASRAKDAFLAALSHELRTPLNPVLMLSAEQAKNEELEADVRADFALIHQNVELEVRLIDDLLDLTRITHGKLELRQESCKLHELLVATLEILRGDLTEKQLSVTKDFSAKVDTVQGDPVRLQQVFWNVLRNAVRFTPKGGSITIRTSEAGEGRLRIAITDNGIGIEKEELEKIFSAFDQGSGGQRFGGLGLGLTISRSLVDAHGGCLRADSEGLDRGTTFTIELPAETPPVIETPLMAVVLPSSSKAAALRILLVEDHEPTRKTLHRLLQRRGYLVQTAENIATARALATLQSFDLLISDLGLPDGNGCDLMSELIAAGGPPGVALSGYGMEEDMERSRTSGFAAHLTKPVDMEALDRVLSRWTGRTD